MGIRIVSYTQLQIEFGIPYSRVHLLRLERTNNFPKRVKVGANRIGWLVSEIEAHLKKKLGDRFPTSDL